MGGEGSAFNKPQEASSLIFKPPKDTPPSRPRLAPTSNWGWPRVCRTPPVMSDSAPVCVLPPEDELPAGESPSALLSALSPSLTSIQALAWSADICLWGDWKPAVTVEGRAESNQKGFEIRAEREQEHSRVSLSV